MASSGDIVLNYGDSLLRASELRILEKNGWLNDVLIGFYFEYLDNQRKLSNGPEMILYPPGISQLIKLACDPAEVPVFLGPTESVEYAFFAVNDSSSTTSASSGSHWSLLIWSRPDNAFLHVDSSSDYNLHSAKELCNSLHCHFSSSSTFKSVKTSQQSNGRDCGLHVALNARLIMEFIQKNYPPPPNLISKVLPSATASQTEKFRGELISLIKKLADEPAK